MLFNECKSIGCIALAPHGVDFCTDCEKDMGSVEPLEEAAEKSLSEKYPHYYKPVGELRELDVYAVHFLFEVQDPSGCIQHASKKLLLSGVRTGGKSAYKDIKEARDTLTRWLQLNQES